jgi:hypothetical protein
VRSPPLFAAFLALAGTALAGDLSPGTRASEYQVKAAFIYNFAKFIEWPPDAVRGEEGAFVITILGADPFGAILDDTLRGRTINTQRIVLRRAARPEELGDSRIVFISDSERDKLPRILKRLEGASILTVGDMDHFAERGGIVCFKTDERDRIRLEINEAMAEQARLRISSELLKLARIVKPRSGG